MRLSRLSFSHAWRMCFDPKAIVPFLVASICLSIIANAAYEMLRNGNSTETDKLFSPFAILMCALIVLLLAIGVLAIVLSRDTEVGEISERTPEKRRGLILLVSHPVACEAAINFHKPLLERVWLICSTDSRSTAADIQAKFPGIQCVLHDPPLDDVENPQQFFQAVRRIYRELLPGNWTSNDIISDCTGMTKPATIGLVMACIGRERPVQYTPAHRGKDGRIIGSLAPVELQFEWAGISRRPPSASVAPRSGTESS